MNTHFEKKFAAILRYCPNIVAYQIWKESADNFSLHIHSKILVRQTTDTHTDAYFTFIIFLLLGVPNGEKKSFSSIRRKRLFETVAIYVLRISGHIKIQYKSKLINR